jgi:drug/metabolite transporter (DMT)-like permease
MGFIFALLSSLFFGASNVAFAVANEHAAIDRYEGLFLSLLVNNVIFIAALPVIYLFASPDPLNWPGLLSYAGAGFFTSFLGRFLLISGIITIGASRTGTAKITAPLFRVFLGVFSLKRKVIALYRYRNGNHYYWYHSDYSRYAKDILRKRPLPD